MYDEFITFCRQCGIQREYMAPHCPEQNDIAEQMNRTFHERAVAMLKHFGLSDGFLAEGLLMAIHIINLSPSRPLGYKIPQELWSGKTSDFGKLRIFGCEAYVLVPKDDRRKLKSRSWKCIFLGYGPDVIFGYRPETR